MAHPLIWPGKVFYYPIGNTSPVSFTQDIPEDVSARILLLGCGDPRSILYTSYIQSRSDRPLDFTCCDHEPAVIARNIILLTMLTEDGLEDKLKNIWNIFFDFYIDDQSFSLLQEHCEKLLAASTTIDVWKASAYSRPIRFCTADTLLQVRQHWHLYVKSASFSEGEKKAFKDRFTSSMKKASMVEEQSMNLSVTRSAGPLAFEAAKTLSSDFDRFWKTGLTDPTSLTTPNVNPTFAYSMGRDNFSVHYGTYPLACFHLAEPFCSNGGVSLLEATISSARKQFHDWCISISGVMRSEAEPSDRCPFVVRFFCGDALAFCKALHHCQETGSTRTPHLMASWRTTHIHLDDSYHSSSVALAPTSFNVVDTSNLVDHLGLINVLIVAEPLLDKTPFSALYTETLLASGADPIAGILAIIFGDIHVMSALIGLAPTTLVSRFATQSNTHEIVLQQVKSKSPQFHERLVWRRPAPASSFAKSPVGRPSFTPDSLSRILTSVFMKMFSNEDPVLMRRAVSTSVSGMRDSTLIHYVRRSFVEFLSHVRRHVDADWDRTIVTTFHAIQDDRSLLLGSNFYHDFCVHMHESGVYTADWLTPSFVASQQRTSTLPALRQWRSVPAVVWIVFTVPRFRLQKVEPLLDQAATPILQCDLQAPRAHNIFPSPIVTYGEVKVTGKGEDKRVEIIEDSKGRDGSSSLVVALQVPSAGIMAEPGFSVALAVRSTPQSIQTLMQRMGPRMQIHKVSLEDKSVHILAHSPFHPERETTAFQELLRSMSISEAPRVNIMMDSASDKIDTMTVRVDVVGAKAKESLSSGASVDMEPYGICAVRVYCGEHSQLHAFPLPVDHDIARLRVARKSSYIEVVSPVVNAASSLTRRFPVYITDEGSALWNVHRLNLDKSPLLNPDRFPANKASFNSHVSLMMSDKERAIHDGTRISDSAAQHIIVNLKESIHSVFLHSFGEQGTKVPCVFGLSDPDPDASRGGVYTLLFVPSIRLDLVGNTFVAECWVLPLTVDTVGRLNTALASIGPGMVQVNTLGKEVEAWKELLPALVERCRTWTHRDTCEYRAEGASIPLSIKHEESPICTCGRGVGAADVELFSGKWKAFVPYVTRAALSPLFAVPYMESVGKFLSGPSATSSVGRAAPPPNGESCAKCHGPGQPSLLQCGRCKAVKYCSAQCQREDWKTHKQVCKS
ncbi:hypothetical protein CONPUDRAFT_125643 [Coniophora puteana RWD-64-598 SS2]|uniref:MYND-type domain-containing protein n=1 Tax=Coniophora puteana (strain RWD-64-598) TaxID=741705 RepID=A0A5M3MQJ4_CONPW|nr:uncharacterized protein CONPUDRAFT_125643 [Coniophora puteana RWD-64-598 SS2]EIW80771.1 hypothetical protein CONPUDRAFT_125643 [Coniophora puteana RWD-64-598 SS2]